MVVFPSSMTICAPFKCARENYSMLISGCCPSSRRRYPPKMIVSLFFAKPEMGPVRFQEQKIGDTPYLRRTARCWIN